MKDRSTNGPFVDDLSYICFEYNYMLIVHPQYITDTAGKKLVVLPANEFDTMMEELEELEDIRLYDEAKKEDDGERMLFDDYLKKRKAKNG